MRKEHVLKNKEKEPYQKEDGNLYLGTSCQSKHAHTIVYLMTIKGLKGIFTPFMSGQWKVLSL